MTAAVREQRSPFARRLRDVWAAGHVHWCVWIFCLAFVVRGVWVLYIDPDPFAGELFSGGVIDPAFYYGTAKILAAGDGFRDPWTGAHTSAFAPGYPLALAVLFKIFGSSLVVAKLFNLVLGAATAVLVYIIATGLRGRVSGAFAGGIVALFPSQVFFSTLVATEVFFVFLSVILLLWLSSRLHQPSALRTWQLVPLGLFLGSMTLVRVEALLLAPALVPLWKALGLTWRQIGIAVMLVLVGMALVVAPWTARNYARFDEFILVRGSGGDSSRVIRIGLAPDYNDTWKYEWSGEEPPSFSDLAEHYSRRPWEVVTTAARKTNSLLGSDASLGWIQAYYEEPPLSHRALRGWTLVANTYYAAVVFFSLVACAFWLSSRARRGGHLGVIVWFALSWSAIYLLVAPVPRYHFPILPMLAVLAAVALVDLWEAAEQSWLPERRRPAVELSELPSSPLD